MKDHTSRCIYSTHSRVPNNLLLRKMILNNSNSFLRDDITTFTHFMIVNFSYPVKKAKYRISSNKRPCVNLKFRLNWGVHFGRRVLNREGHLFRNY